MVFSGNVFLFYFLPITLLFYYISKNRVWRNVWLLIVSLVFYAWGEPVYVLLMMASITANWLFARLIASARERGSGAKSWAVTAIAVNLATIGVFKYADFVIGTINAFGPQLTLPGIALPIGISFYTFQALSYVIDVYRGKVAVQKNILYVGAYITMFPQLIAGPIVRYTDIAYEMENRRESLEDFAEGVRRFIVGLAKKALLANTMAIITEEIYAHTPNYLTPAAAWMGALAYFFQIYFDFSGYSDMAIGLGRMFGFHFLENFNYPYISRSITDFWRRWHMSLSSFFRDYVYIPLGGNRVSKPRWLLNLMIVWCLTGLWHGASWNFVLWGLYYGVILILEKLFLLKVYDKLPKVFGWAVAMFIVIIGWVIFWREDMGDIWPYIRAMFGASPVTPVYTLRFTNTLQFWPWLILCAFCATPLPMRIMNAMRRRTWSDMLLTILLLGLFGLSVVYIVTGTYNPFIYFRF